MTAVLKNVYIYKLDQIVNKYNVTYHRVIKIKLNDVKSGTYIDFDGQIMVKNLNLKVCDQVRISKYKNIVAKAYTLIWSEEVFVIKKVKNNVPWTYVVINLNGEQIIGNFKKDERFIAKDR